LLFTNSVVRRKYNANRKDFVADLMIHPTAIILGVPHMRLGMWKRGIGMIAMALIVLFVAFYLLDGNPIAFLATVPVWVYSLFDVRKQVERYNEGVHEWAYKK